MDQTEAVLPAPTDAELERAIVSVPGVVSAQIRRDEETGRSRMRLRLAGGEDERTVAWAVAATLRERFGITLDPDAIRPRREGALDEPVRDPVRVLREPDAPAPLRDAPESATGEASPPVTRGRTPVPRAMIRGLEVDRRADHVEAIVTLARDGVSTSGHARAIPTSHGTLRAVAEATVAALRALAREPLLASIDRVCLDERDEEPVATVVVSLLGQQGEERLLGAALVCDEPERAVMLATLDALNRRVVRLLAGTPRTGEPGPGAVNPEVLGPAAGEPA